MAERSSCQVAIIRSSDILIRPKSDHSLPCPLPVLILERSDFGYWNFVADVIDIVVDVLDDIVGKSYSSSKWVGKQHLSV